MSHSAEASAETLPMPALRSPAPAPAGSFRAARGRRAQPDGGGAAGGLRLGQRASDGIAADERAAHRSPRRQIAHAKEDQRQGELDELVGPQAPDDRHHGAEERLRRAPRHRHDRPPARPHPHHGQALRQPGCRPGGNAPATSPRKRRTKEPKWKPRTPPGNRLRPADAARTLSPGRTRPRSRTEPPSPAQTRAAATEAARAEVRRRLFCYEHLITHHPELSSEIRDLSDTSPISTPTTTCSRRSFGRGRRTRAEGPGALRNDDK